jgi:hypothetical protein
VSLVLGVSGVDSSSLTLHDVLAVDVRDLPAEVVAVIGIAYVRLLGLSLDAILARPGCDLAKAIGGNWRSRNFFPNASEREVSEEDTYPNELGGSQKIQATYGRGGTAVFGYEAECAPGAQDTSQARPKRTYRCSHRATVAPPRKRSRRPSKRSPPSGEKRPRKALQSPLPCCSMMTVSAEDLASKEKEKFYAVRVGRRVGFVRTWEECQRSVSGYSSAECKSFLTIQKAEAHVKGPRTKYCYVNWTAPEKAATKPRPASFVAGRALRATVTVLQEGETRPIQVQGCLDSG